MQHSMRRPGICGALSRASKSTLLALSLICLFSLAGCGGGGGGGSSTPPVNTGAAQTSLNNLASGNTPPTTTNVSNNASEWQTLYNQNPNNPTVASGFAISEAALAGLDFDNAIGGPTPSVARQGKRGAAIAAHALALNQFGEALAIWRIPSLLSENGQISWPRATDMVPGSVVFNPPNAAHLQAALAALNTALAQCEQALLVPLASPTFTFTIADPINHADTQGLKLGQVEFNLLYTVCAALRGVINPTLAYDLSYTNYNQGTGLYSIAQTQMSTNGDTIGPALYMPASPFLTLNTNGATDMSTAKSEINAAATHGTDAINEVQTRNNAGYLIDPGTFISTQEYSTIESQIQIYLGYVNGTTATVEVVNGDGNTVTTQIDPNAWFTNPPADLKAFEPTYGVVVTSDASSSTGFDTTLTLQGSSYPDLKFGGLFPNGFPLPVSESNNVIGPADPTTAAFELNVVSSESLGWLSPGLDWLTYDTAYVEQL